MTFKILYFLRLKGEIAPLIDIIIIILYEIRWFVIVFIIFQLASMCALYSIGRNQLEVARETGESDDIPYYSTYFGAFMFVYEASLGGYNTQWYKDNRFTGILVPFHILTSFIMTVYLLNMLVGLMGESFANNKENKEANKKISELAFIVDNWWINPISNKEKFVYLIAAFKVEDSHDEEDERFASLEMTIKSLGKNLINEMKEMNHAIQHLAQ